MNKRYALALITILAGMITPAMGKDNGGTPLFTAQQAAAGKSLFAAKCAQCHGEALQGGTAGALAGPAYAATWSYDEFQGDWAQPTVDDLDYIIRATMPKDNPGTLTPGEYTEVLSYILQQNGYPSGTTPLRAGSPRMKQARLRFGIAPELASAPPPLRIQGEPTAVPRDSGPTQAELNRAASSTRDWLYVTHDYSGTRYVPLDQINVKNAARLRPVCVNQLGGVSNFQSGPIVYQGTMYVTTDRDTVALDAVNCRLKWRYSWLPHAAEAWRNSRGIALKDGYLVRGTPDGYLLALNAKTGALVWAVKAADARLGEAFTMPPLIYEDLVVIGPAGSENAVSGWVGAFRLRDGTPVWKFNTVPGAVPEGSETWRNPNKIKLGGGALWTPLSFDAENGELFVAVGNPAPDFAANLRPGDNLYTNSVVVLDIHTGKLLWYKQTLANDAHDWDMSQVSPLFQEKINGRDTRLVATVGKDGILRTIDRDSHEVVYATPVTTIKNADVPLTTEGVLACPGSFGGVEWNGPALNRKLNMLYINAVDWCYKFTLADTIRHIPGRVYLGGTIQAMPESQGWLTAVDASSGKVKWKYRSKRPMVGAVTTTSGGVVFTGELTGDFLVLNARDGKDLYRFNTGAGIGGGVVTYSEAGKQYVAVMSGKPSRFWINEIVGAPTVFLFALP